MGVVIQKAVLREGWIWTLPEGCHYSKVATATRGWHRWFGIDHLRSLGFSTAPVESRPAGDSDCAFTRATRSAMDVVSALSEARRKPKIFLARAGVPATVASRYLQPVCKLLLE
jgi:hypothetical protein